MTARTDSHRWDLSSPEKRRVFDEMVSGKLLRNQSVVVEIVEAQRSDSQNSALHLWCEMVAKHLNDLGMDMRKTLRQDMDIPWTKSSVKEYIWRKVQEPMTGEHSTTRPSKTQYPDISETIHRHFAQRFGITLPAWPTREL